MLFKKLKDIAVIQSGYQARSCIVHDIKGTHRLIQGKDLNENNSLFINNLTSFFPERNPDLYKVNKGDILFQSRGIKSTAFLIEEDLKDTLAAGSFYIIHVKSDIILPAYLAWWLNQPYAQSYFQENSGGATILFIPKKAVEEFKLKIPPVPIQKKITKIIELWKKEENLRNNISKLRSRLIENVLAKTVENQGDK